MAWLNTYDERYTGGFLSNDADDYDAPSIRNSTYRLAPNDTGYGNLSDQYVSADRDIYSLGFLSTGNYHVDVDEWTWDFSSFGFGSVGSFRVIDNLGFTVATSSSVYSDLDFVVPSSGIYYVEIEGSSSFFEQQYSVRYFKTSELNTPAVWTSATYTGDLIAGSSLDASVVFSDVDGNSDGVCPSSGFLGPRAA